MLNYNACLRTDIHPAAVIESECPITECMTCGLPVPEEANGNIFCDVACEDKALEQALLEDMLSQIIIFSSSNNEEFCSCHTQGI